MIDSSFCYAPNPYKNLLKAIYSKRKNYLDSLTNHSFLSKHTGLEGVIKKASYKTLVVNFIHDGTILLKTENHAKYFNLSFEENRLFEEYLYTFKEEMAINRLLNNI